MTALQTNKASRRVDFLTRLTISCAVSNAFLTPRSCPLHATRRDTSPPLAPCMHHHFSIVIWIASWTAVHIGQHSAKTLETQRTSKRPLDTDTNFVQTVTCWRPSATSERLAAIRGTTLCHFQPAPPRPRERSHGRPHWGHCHALSIPATCKLSHVYTCTCINCIHIH